MSTAVTLSLLALLMSATVTTDQLDSRIQEAEQARKSCGPRAVWYCLRRFGIEVPFATVCRDADLDADGSSLRALLNTFQQHGVPAEAVVGSPDRLGELPVPSVLVIDDSHCVVFEGVDPARRRVRYYEPSEGRMREASIEAFQKGWSGQAIVFEPPQMSVASFGKLALVGAAATWLFAGLGIVAVRTVRAMRRSPPS